MASHAGPHAYLRRTGATPALHVQVLATENGGDEHDGQFTSAGTVWHFLASEKLMEVPIKKTANKTYKNFIVDGLDFKILLILRWNC